MLKIFMKNKLAIFELCKCGLLERYGVNYDNPDAYQPQENEQSDFAFKLKEKLDYELSIITEAGFIDDFLVAADFTAWARKNGIATGPGTGVIAGSLLAYILKITDIDPVHFGLLFERILSRERISHPKFCADFCPRRLNEVIEYVRKNYGEKWVSNMNFSGLNPLSIISDAQENIRRKSSDSNFNIEKISLCDNATLSLFKSGLTSDIFQFEDETSQNLCRQISLDTFEEIAALIALNRTGAMQFVPQFINAKKDKSTFQILHPLLKELVEETYGVLIYQEQIMMAAKIISGCTLGEADILRRTLGKKKPLEIANSREVFVAGAKLTNEIEKINAEKIFAELEKYAPYAFSKSHAVAYALIAYRMAYLKSNYPNEFASALHHGTQ